MGLNGLEYTGRALDCGVQEILHGILNVEVER